MRTHILSLLFLGALLISLPACSKYSDFCEKWMNCVGGNDKDIDACIEATGGEEDTADAYGCGDEYDAAFDCAEENASCKNGDFDKGDDCDDKASALSKCIKAASSRK